MAWTNAATQKAIEALEGGSIFGSLEELGARKIVDIVIGQVYTLLRFEVFTTTQNHQDPYVTLELDAGNGPVFFSSYARAIGNQLTAMAKAAALDPANGTTVTDKKAWTDVPVELPVTFSEETSKTGKYRQMAFYDASKADIEAKA